MTQKATQQPIGWWIADGDNPPRPDGRPHSVRAALEDLAKPVTLVGTEYGLAAANGTGMCVLNDVRPYPHALPIRGYTAALHPRQLGEPTFRSDHGLEYAYMAGAMANGIASVELVQALANEGVLASFGAAGLSLERIEDAVVRLKESLGDRAFACNLIHSPNEPRHEAATAELYIKHKVPLVEASAFLDLTPAVVRYRLHGIRRAADGRVEVPNHLIAKVSRVELAEKFLSPAPERLVRGLVAAGQLTAEQAELAKTVPVARDVTVEADSGGHTDNRPALTLLPTICALRDRLRAKYHDTAPLRVGLAGGVATPASAAAAFACGAAYVVTGTVNQACVESGSSDITRAMLAEAGQADVAMAPAADMFEMGVKVQVLKRGTMFPMRAQKLYDLYRRHDSIDAIPAAERQALEKNFFRIPLEEVWRQTEGYFRTRDPEQIDRAGRDPKHKMSLIFRWYLGQSSRWANSGVADRKLDYQVWCGPAMGAFNEWARGSFLEPPAGRTAAAVALNLLYGAALTLRLNCVRAQGVALPPEAGSVRPLPLDELKKRLSPPA